MPSSQSSVPLWPSGLRGCLSKLALTALLAASLLVGIGLGPASGRQQDGKLSLLLSHQSKVDKDVGVELRPNVAQNVYVFVKNDDNKDRTVTVELRANGNVETTQQVKAAAGKVTAVPFAAAPKTPTPAPLTATSGAVSFRLVEGKDAVGEDVKLPVAPPSKYVEAKARFFAADEKKGTPNRLEVRVNRKGTFPFVTPPGCQVELDLSRIEGLVPGARKEGRYSGYLPADEKSTLILEARNLRFAEGAKGKAGGFVSLSVDGYPGALLFVGNFDVTKDSAEAALEQTTAVCRIDCAPVAIPSAKFPVKLEVDANVALIDKLRLGVLSSVEKDKEGNVKETYAEVAEFAGPRQVAIRYARGGPGGSLIFHPEVKYWSTTIDVSGITGATRLRLVALKGNDAPVEVRDGSRPGKPGPSVSRDLRLDDSKADLVEFVHRPRRAARGRTIEFGVRAADQESGITRVRYYLGKTFPYDKLPQELPIVEGVYVEEEDVWSAVLSVPADQKSPLRVNVVAINGVGLPETKSIDLEVVDAPPMITGKVLEKGVPVENATVLLVDPKDVVEDRVQSGKEGVFVFAGVPRGSYRLMAKRTDSKVRAERTVVVKDLTPIVDQHLNLEEPTTISGKVFEDDVAVENQIVKLVTEKGELRAWTRSGPGGTFTLINVLKGNYRLEAERPSTRAVAELPIEITQLTPLTGVELLLKTPKGTAAINGKVVELDVPIDNATVQLINADNEVIDKTRTSGGGKFAFKAVANGMYRVKAARPSTPSVGEAEVVISNLRSVKDVELILKTGKGLTARIEGTVMEGNRPQAGVPVQLLNTTNQVVATATTDGQGRFVLENLPKGSFRIFARKSSSQTQALKPIDLDEGQEVKGVEVKLYRR